jgi:hypothetical protein
MGPWDTWQHRSPQRGGGVRSCWTCGSTGALLSGEAGSIDVGHMAALEPSAGRSGSGATGHVVAPKPSLDGRWGPELRDTCHHRSPPERGGWDRSSGTRGNMWYHVMLLVLALCLYVRVPSL